jgi:hypothetical protein
MTLTSFLSSYLHKAPCEHSEESLSEFNLSPHLKEKGVIISRCFKCKKFW